MQRIIEATAGADKISVRGGRWNGKAVDSWQSDCRETGGAQVNCRLWTRREALAGLGVWLGLSGCGAEPSPEPAAAGFGIRPSERPIEAIYSQRHKTDVPRTVLECPRGKCIVLHFPVREDYEPDAMNDLLSGASDTDSDDGQIVTGRGTSWQVDRPEQLGQFNCCAYAVGDAIGLGRGDWLCGEVNPLTDGTNPMHVVLESYFERVAEFPPPFSESGINQFETSSVIRDNDVVCLVGSRGPDYPHAMRVRDRKGRHWVVGKFGEDPVLWTPIATVANAYEGQFDRVWVFRLKKSVQQGRR